MSFEERFGLLVDRERVMRDIRRLQSRLKRAKLSQPASQLACMEDIDYRHPRGLDKSQMQSLGSCQWIRDRLHVLITGKTGLGKSYLAQALAHRACVEGYTAIHWRVPRLFQELAIARGDGRYPRLLRSLGRAHVLVLDDWGLAQLEDRDDPEAARVGAEVAQQIYDLRTKANLTQADLAKLVGTSRTVITRLEDNDYDGHSVSMLQRIASVLRQRIQIRFVPADSQSKAPSRS